MYLYFGPCPFTRVHCAVNSVLPIVSVHSVPVVQPSYRIAENVNLPFKVVPVIEEHGKTRVVLNVKIIANYSSELSGNNVVVKIPVPPTTANCELVVSSGRYELTFALGEEYRLRRGREVKGGPVGYGLCSLVFLCVLCLLRLSGCKCAHVVQPRGSYVDAACGHDACGHTAWSWLAQCEVRAGGEGGRVAYPSVPRW